MYFKYLIILGALFLISCGGGSSYGGGSGGANPGGSPSAASPNNGQITDQLQIVE